MFNVQVESILLHELKKVTAFAREHENEFVDLVMKKSEKELNQTLKTSHREFEQVKSRIRKLDTIVQRLYEDNLDGKITDERFMIMSSSYDNEQAELTQKIQTLEELICRDIFLSFFFVSPDCISAYKFADFLAIQNIYFHDKF